LIARASKSSTEVLPLVSGAAPETRFRPYPRQRGRGRTPPARDLPIATDTHP